ncbi:MAG: NAD(P)/FAD-dependent oxidoreductase [Bacteriovoracaceae bacterium]|nr:NAD(P)/FAD-dependent oxidoreductase [Bacteriovoracaceae bacterium]
MLLKTNEKVQGHYDVIIIGSGLAGLTAANILGRHGRKVLLVEAHNKLGGFATWFYRSNKKYIFDVSLHGFPIGMKKTCRKYWNIDIANKIIQLKDVRFANPQFKLQTEFTRVDFTQKLIEHFGVPAETVEAFFNFVREMNFYDNNQMTNHDLFEKFFPGRTDIVRFLMEPITYANGSTLEDPAITYGIVFSNFMSQGVYTFQGGTDLMIKMMRDELLQNSVDIKMQTKIEKVVVENKAVKGVIIEGELITAKAVLSNGNLLSTIFQMVGADHFSSEFVTKAKAVRLNSSSCQVYMAIKENESIPHIGDLVFTSTAPTFNTEELLAKKVTSRTFSVYYPDTRPQEATPKYYIVSSTNSHYADWATMDEATYQTEKELLIEDTLKSLEKFIPDIRAKIDFIDCATPCTVERYTLHQKGASFGTKFEGLDISMNLQKEITGLYHAGSVGIIMSGWLGAANYGVIQSNQVESYLYQLEKAQNFMNQNAQEDQHA